MTLRSALKVSVAAKYMIDMRRTDGEYETIILDYTNPLNDEFTKALKRKDEFIRTKHKVQWITPFSGDWLHITLYEI